MRKSDLMQSAPPPRPKFDKRRDKLLVIAARCFNEQGYDAASMRDIAREMKILPGTIYYYFPSKESLLVAVHQEGVRRISAKIEEALAKSSADPWQRLSDAAAAYLKSMLGVDRDLCAVIIAEFPRRHSKTLRAQLLANREVVEAHFRQLVADLPLRRGVDRSLWRLALMGQLAWTHAWYRPGKQTPEQIGRKLVDFLRRDSEA
ncbi:MAG: TetR/AcrR family transcriptional regulator [Reyranellaceae bacterium]